MGGGERAKSESSEEQGGKTGRGERGGRSKGTWIEELGEGAWIEAVEMGRERVK